MAKKRAPRKRGKGFGLERISEDMRLAATQALRIAAKEVLSDLAAAGPNWRGSFRDSWYAETSDGKKAVKIGGEEGKYNLFNIPQLATQGRNSKGQFTRPALASAGKVELRLGNFSPHAMEAMDLIPGRFVYPGVEPEGREEPRGERVGGIRGRLRKPGRNRSTAPLDWYSTYMEGGSFAAAFNKGCQAGFLQPVARSRFNRPAE